MYGVLQRLSHSFHLRTRNSFSRVQLLYQNLGIISLRTLPPPHPISSSTRTLGKGTDSRNVKVLKQRDRRPPVQHESPKNRCNYLRKATYSRVHRANSQNGHCSSPMDLEKLEINIRPPIPVTENHFVVKTRPLSKKRRTISLLHGEGEGSHDSHS